MASGTPTKPTMSNLAEEEALPEADRLSNLPNSLLHHILSFTDTKYAVQLSLLSTRFKDLWTSLPNLNFDRRSFNMEDLSFDKFVATFLSHHRHSNSNLISINYHNNGSSDPLQPLERTLKYAVLHNIQTLKIYSYCSTEIPRELFACQSLKTLHIISPTKMPSYFDLPNLTSLRLEHVSLDQTISEDGVWTLSFPGCLKLKSLGLILNNSLRESYETFHLICPQLENFTFSDYYTVKPKFMMITARKLTYFKFCGSLHTRFSADSLASLEKIHIDGHVYKYYDSLNEEGARDLNEMIMQFSNAKFVTITSATVQILSELSDFLEHLPSPFTNLKSLKLMVSQKCITSKGFDKVITYLLNSSPGAAVVVRPY